MDYINELKKDLEDLKQKSKDLEEQVSNISWTCQSLRFIDCIDLSLTCSSFLHTQLVYPSHLSSLPYFPGDPYILGARIYGQNGYHWFSNVLL